MKEVWDQKGIDELILKEVQEANARACHIDSDISQERQFPGPLRLIKSPDHLAEDNGSGESSVFSRLPEVSLQNSGKLVNFFTSLTEAIEYNARQAMKP